MEDNQRPQKSIFKAYVFWLFGGIFGVHLFYLERDSHAFLTWSTLGGLGLGWLADVTKIPSYVRDCNDDPQFLTELGDSMRKNTKPPFSRSRFISSIMMGYIWGKLITIAIPPGKIGGINWNIFHWCIPLAVGLGVCLVGNIGRERGKPWITLIVCYISYTSTWYRYFENISLILLSFCAELTFDTASKEWRKTPYKKQSFTKRISVLFVCALLYIGLWSSYLYFNGKVTYSSPRFRKAYKILGVGPWSGQSEITAQWRALSREFHPDKVKDSQFRRETQEKFIEVQKAYEILSDINSKRRRKNRKSDTV